MSADQVHSCDDTTPSSPEIHFEPVVTLAKVDVKTFEENEEEMVKLRAKLFRYIIGQHDTSPEWKERGIGDVKILKNRAKHSYRLVMRREKTLKVCANHFLTKDMELKPNCGSDRAWVWNVSADYADEEPRKETLAIRFANAENAKKFKEVFDKCKEKVGNPANDVESEKLANELESLKVNDDSEKQGDEPKESSGEGTSTETNAEEPQEKVEETEKEPDTVTESKSETSDNPPEKTDDSPPSDQ